jgi:hypothetical protein
MAATDGETRAAPASLECDNEKREQTAGKAGFPLRNGSDDVGRRRVGGRFVKTLVLQGDSL